MKNLNPKYYEPLEQMMSVRHQYMGKIISSEGSHNIYDFFKNQHILDLGCGTGKFLHNYYELGAICSGVDLVNNFQFQNKKNYKLINSNFQNFLKKNKKKFDIIFIFEFLVSTKFPIFDPDFKIVPGLMRAYGPTTTLLSILEFSIWLKDFIIVLFPIFTFRPITT